MNNVTIELGGALYPLPAPAYAVAYTVREIKKNEKFAIIFVSKTKTDEDDAVAVRVAEKEFPRQEWRPLVSLATPARNDNGVVPARRYTTIPFMLNSVGEPEIDADIHSSTPALSANAQSLEVGFADYSHLSRGLEETRKLLESSNLPRTQE
jgi:hypothetical protein